MLNDYESPEDEIIDGCYGAKMRDEIADFAPLHAVLEYLVSAICDIGFHPNEAEGKRILLAVAKVVVPYTRMLEHNPWLACFYCKNEVLPVVDQAFLDRFWQWRSGKLELPEFYRCPECGAAFNALRTRRKPDRHLPWFHYQHGDDFDVADAQLPKE